MVAQALGAIGGAALCTGPQVLVCGAVGAVLVTGALVGAWWISSSSVENADEQAGTQLDSGTAAATCATGNCPPPECKNLVDNMDHKNRKLKKELNQYNPASDAQGGHSYMGADGLMKLTKPGGHYKEIRDIQRGLKNDLEQYNKRKCYSSQGPADKATREAAQKGLNEPIEVPPGSSFIPL
jgi:hypothetical protein